MVDVAAIRSLWNPNAAGASSQHHSNSVFPKNATVDRFIQCKLEAQESKTGARQVTAADREIVDKVVKLVRDDQPDFKHGDDFIKTCVNYHVNAMASRLTYCRWEDLPPECHT